MTTRCRMIAGATVSAPIPTLTAPGCPTRPGWTVEHLPAGRAQIIAHHGLRTIARDVRADEAEQIARSANAHHDLVDALREAAQWLESVGEVCKIPSVLEAGARARATLAAVQS